MFQSNRDLQVVRLYGPRRWVGIDCMASAIAPHGATAMKKMILKKGLN